MNVNRRATIRRQLTRRLLVAFGVPLVLAGVGGYVLIRANLQGRFDAVLLAKAEEIMSATTWDEGHLRVDTSAPFMREFDAPSATPELPVEPGFFEVLRYDDGAVLARSASLRDNQVLAHVSMPLGRQGRPTPWDLSPTSWNVSLPSGIAGRLVVFAFVPHMPHEGTTPGPIDAILIVGTDRRDLDRTLSTVAAVLGGVGLLLATAIAIAVSTGLRRELTPLDALADRASRIDANSLAARFPVAALPGELVPIAERLNDLLSRLEHAFDRERQFSANVAHELRTPIAELRTAAELSLKWPDTRQADVDRDTLAIARQMEGIVTRLLALLRSERGELPIAREPLAIAAMLHHVWQPFSAGATAKHLDVTWSVCDDIIVHTDPVLLQSILTNLIENAVDYTPPRGTLRVELTRNGGFCLRIINTVDALTHDDVAKLFDPFWRHDTARAGSEHSGLGLSLARAFADALHYELIATLEPEARTLALTLRGATAPSV